ncbi:MAG: hypothetical protein CVT92_16545 [Bacteroidetes bacterium HGW-Bacteroidetes-1]|jgi:hypothetical protein|nr:MAG: hypothetical protein CVT92_16545 [Bacteroidetes bacterium HGW-Bacteroidetes-1]
MTAFNVFYITCPNCNATLTGKKLRAIAINYSELYSDGKMVCNELISEPQKIIKCPSCANIFWLPEIVDEIDSEIRATPSDEVKEEKIAVYSYKSWYQFGCNTSLIEGKKALIDHHFQLLVMLKPFTVEQELYLRRSLLWACNDLIRFEMVNKLSRLFSGSFSFQAWRRERHDRIIQKILFLKLNPVYKSNISRMIELIKVTKEKESDKAYLAELYREKGNFAKAMEIVNELHRSTHYVYQIHKKITKKSTSVFKVAG